MFFCLRNLYKGVSDRKIVIGFLLCCILYFLINALYLVKYGARYTSYYPIIVLIYAIFLIGFIFFKHKNKPSLKQVVILLAVNAIAIIILQILDKSRSMVCYPQLPYVFAGRRISVCGTNSFRRIWFSFSRMATISLAVLSIR